MREESIYEYGAKLDTGNEVSCTERGKEKTEEPPQQTSEGECAEECVTCGASRREGDTENPFVASAGRG